MARRISTGTVVQAGVVVTAGDTFTVVTTSQTAVSGSAFFANTSAGAFTITLPAAPILNDFVVITDVAGAFEKYNLTIARNSNLIMGQAQDLIVNVLNASLTLVYSGATYGWKLV